MLHKVFREYNQERSDTRALLLKNKSEIERKLLATKISFGLKEIDKGHLRRHSSTFERPADADTQGTPRSGARPIEREKIHC